MVVWGGSQNASRWEEQKLQLGHNRAEVSARQLHVCLFTIQKISRPTFARVDLIDLIDFES